MHTRATATAVAIAAVLSAAATAQAAQFTSGADSARPWATPAVKPSQDERARLRSGFSVDGQHGPSANHLPARRENMEIVGKLEATAPFGDVNEGQIADVAVHKGFAYLMSWDDPDCKRGGFHVADIRDPANPKDVGFVPATPGYYHGEGAHAVTLDTPAFKGDLLAVNNEAYSGDCGTQPTSTGGFELYDVSNPAAPVPLVKPIGDTTGEDTPGVGTSAPNSYHSVFVWQDGPRAYLVGVDNVEGSDVDIWDITDPRAPALVGDHNLAELFPAILDDGLGNQGRVFHHDAVVKAIGGRQIMLASYWDAGYVQLDVSDPANPTLVNDTGFGDDPLVEGVTPAEGNAHQAEFSADDQLLLAADEDFSPYRAGVFSITTGPNAGTYPSAEIGGAVSVASLPDRKLNGPTVYGGYGCPGSARPIPERSSVNLTLATGEEAILVLQRGPVNDPADPGPACFPGQKAAEAAAKGWDTIVIVNRALGSAANDGPFCGSGGFTTSTVAVCTTHAAGHRIFGTTPTFETGQADDVATIGQVGERIQATSQFDGWGYTHLYDRSTGEELDAFAIEEALDPRYAFGFGDLSVHEFATDPQTNLAYAAYYAGGLRVFRFGRERGLEQTGVLIDEGGSNFWGVEQFTAANGERLIAGSDRDFGLYIARYTGPGAVGPRPVPATTPTETPAATAPGIVKKPASFFAFGKLRRIELKGGRVTVSFRVPGAGQMVGTLRARIGKRVVPLATRSIKVSKAGIVRVPLRVRADKLRSLKRTLASRRTNRTSAILRATFIPVGAPVEEGRTRNRSVSLTVR